MFENHLSRFFTEKKQKNQREEKDMRELIKKQNFFNIK